MNYEILNEMVNYVEEHLLDKIDYDKLAKNLGVNVFIMQRVFSIVVNVTFSEYVRKRRLSLAFEEIKLTNLLSQTLNGLREVKTLNLKQSLNVK